MAPLDNVVVELLVRAHLCPQKASGPAVAETEMRLLKKKKLLLNAPYLPAPMLQPGALQQ